jgi:hypothetical protein
MVVNGRCLAVEEEDDDRKIMDRFTELYNLLDHKAEAESYYIEVGPRWHNDGVVKMGIGKGLQAGRFAWRNGIALEEPRLELCLRSDYSSA